MQNSISLSSDTPVENVRFVFPKNPELALYALATLQSFAEYYYKAVERVRLWHEYPDLQRQLHIYVHCDQQFYTTFIDSFPSCAEFVLPGDELETDELCVVLHEKVLEQFNTPPGYSVQWVMGQLAGTKPQLVPGIKAGELGTTVYAHHQYKVDLPNVQYFVADMVNNNCMLAYRIASGARMVIAPQGLLTVLAIAMGVPVVEVTKTASHRPFVGGNNYVQVSMLTPHQFFMNSLQRGVQWLLKKITSMSSVSNVETPLAELQQPMASPQPLVKSV